MKKNARWAIRLYPIYEAMTGDLLFYSVIEILFLTLVKGFSDEQIALLFLISDVADLALEYPTYRIIRKLGNSKAVIVGALMPLISIVLITIGNSLPVVIGEEKIDVLVGPGEDDFSRLIFGRVANILNLD